MYLRVALNTKHFNWNDAPPTHSADPLHVDWPGKRQVLLNFSAWSGKSEFGFQENNLYSALTLLSPDPLQLVSVRLKSGPVKIEGRKFHRRVAVVAAGSVAFLTTGHPDGSFHRSTIALGRFSLVEERGWDPRVARWTGSGHDRVYNSRTL